MLSAMDCMGVIESSTSFATVTFDLTGPVTRHAP